MQFLAMLQLQYKQKDPMHLVKEKHEFLTLCFAK